MNLSVTPRAAKRIIDIISKENSSSVLRIIIKSGGCGAFKYSFALDTSTDVDDAILTMGNAKIAVDAVSQKYLDGATLDYVEEFLGTHFVIINPNAKSICGCGSSFSV